MRKGPHPLPLHLGIAFAQHMPDDPYNLKFKHGLSTAELEDMMRGIRMYHEHPYKRKAQKLCAVWESGATRLYSIRSQGHKTEDLGTPLILIPSLINKADILDLSKERSLLRWLSARGRECYLLDWGNELKDNAQDIDINDIVFEKLASSIRHVSEIHQRPVDCMGYCMGGTLLMGAQNALMDRIRRMVLLAAPWNFHDPEMRLTDHIGLWSPAALPVIRERGYLPAAWIQSLFATLDPEGSARKFIRFSKMDQDSEAAKLFVLVEDWLNAGVDLPAALAHQCIQEWFMRNASYKGVWRVGNAEIDPSAIKTKTLIIGSHRDRLVPLSAAIALKSQMKNAAVDTLALQCGHIGFIAGKNSIVDVWSPMAAWLSDP